MRSANVRQKIGDGGRRTRLLKDIALAQELGFDVPGDATRLPVDAGAAVRGYWSTTAADRELARQLGFNVADVGRLPDAAIRAVRAHQAKDNQ